MDQQVGLQLGDPRPVLQVAPFRRLLDDLRVLRRQAGDRTLQAADRGQIFFQPLLIAAAQRLSSATSPRSLTASRMLFLRSIQYCSLEPNSRSNSRCGIISGGSGRSRPAQLMLR